jgi:hypothetical protein
MSDCPSIFVYLPVIIVIVPVQVYPTPAFTWPPSTGLLNWTP